MPFYFLIQNFAEMGHRFMSYGQKSDFQDGGERHLGFLKKIQFFVTWLSSGSISNVVYQISIKIGRFFTEIWRFYDFQNGGRPPSWILKICSFCHVVLVGMPFCFLVQNFAEIWQSVDELWPKKRFSRWRPTPSWILKISIFGHVTVIGFNICFSVPNFIKIGWFFTEIWWFSDLQNGGRPPSWICYDVIILLRRTHFRCPNIVLKFLDDWCCSFRDTCNVIRHPCGCT